jgi:hypothetical protein
MKTFLPNLPLNFLRMTQTGQFQNSCIKIIEKFKEKADYAQSNTSPADYSFV